MKSRPYLVSLFGVNLSRRPLCFRSTRLWNVTILAVAIPTQSEYADDRCEWNVKNVRVISMQSAGRHVDASKLSAAARNRLDDLFLDEGPIESALWEALDNRADYTGDLADRMATLHDVAV